MTEAWKLPRPERESADVQPMPKSTTEARPATNNKQTLIEDGTEFKGILSSTCPIVVRGKIEGEVFGPSLRVSSSGLVAGTVKVDEIQSEGVLSGEFDAVRVELSGQVRDKTVIRAKSMEVKLAPANGRMEVVFGECDLDVGEPPSKEAAIQQVVSSPSAEAADSAPKEAKGDKADKAKKGDDGGSGGKKKKQD